MPPAGRLSLLLALLHPVLCYLTDAFRVQYLLFSRFVRDWRMPVSVFIDQLTLSLTWDIRMNEPVRAGANAEEAAGLKKKQGARMQNNLHHTPCPFT